MKSDYTQKSNIASSLEVRFNQFVRTTRENANEYNESLLDKVISLGIFASEVAKTIKSTRRVNDDRIEGGYRISPKQAWILACAIVENNINY